MHNTKPCSNPVHLVHKDDGIVRTFKSFNDVVRHWVELRKLDIGAQFKIVYDLNNVVARIRYEHARERYFPVGHHEFVLRDSFGDILDPEDIKKAYRKDKPYRYPRWANHHPGSKPSMGWWIRRPKTIQEARWVNAWDDEEFAPRVRARRNAKNLPNAWDDEHRSDLAIRNWKQFRRTQWKT